MTKAKIEAFKGFDKDLRCDGFQYEVGETYSMDSIGICARSFHSYENPLDVWGYYDVVGSRFAIVEPSGKIQRNKGGDSKLCSAEITIKAELTLPEFIKRAVAWVIDATKGKNSSGYYARIGSSGNFARVGSSGDYAQIGSSGNSARIGSSGNYAQIGSSGDYAQIGSSGYSAQIGSSGDYAQIEAVGKDSVVAAAGPDAQIRGAVGTWVSLAEYDSDGKCIGFASGQIEKTDTWYRAQGGKLVEIEQ